ncbi:hypothetical protein [Mesoplasma photuris]|uniref:hypothetical protein n=1 Tax=Mesoplasma photuris TaxID=217731 RepID=UPI0004E21CC2|nr:hypothetical protein [Mesoplasma photuris]
MKEITRITDGNMELAFKLLDKGEIVELAAFAGPEVEKTIKNKFSGYLNANAEVIERGENLGVCGCGEPANVILKIWR